MAIPVPWLIVVGIFAGVVIASILGTIAANWFSGKQHEDRMETLRQETLAKIAHLCPGFVVPDAQLETLQFEPTLLSDYVRDGTVLAFIEPGCEACMEEMSLLGQTLVDSSSFAKIVFISAGNPRELMDIAKDHATSSTILYDHKRAYCSELGIITFPFHLVVDSNLVVKEAIRGRLGEERIKNLLLN